MRFGLNELLALPAELKVELEERRAWPEYSRSEDGLTPCLWTPIA